MRKVFTVPITNRSDSKKRKKERVAWPLSVAVGALCWALAAAITTSRSILMASYLSPVLSQWCGSAATPPLPRQTVISDNHNTSTSPRCGPATSHTTASFWARRRSNASTRRSRRRSCSRASRTMTTTRRRRSRRYPNGRSARRRIVRGRRRRRRPATSRRRRKAAPLATLANAAATRTPATAAAAVRAAEAARAAAVEIKSTQRHRSKSSG